MLNAQIVMLEGGNFTINSSSLAAHSVLFPVDAGMEGKKGLAKWSVIDGAVIKLLRVQTADFNASLCITLST